MNGKQEGQGKSVEITAGQLKNKAELLRQKLNEIRPQQGSPKGGPNANGGQAIKRADVGGERSGKGNESKGKEGNPKLVRLGVGNGKDVGTKVAGNGTGSTRAVVKQAVFVAKHSDVIRKALAANPLALERLHKTLGSPQSKVIKEPEAQRLGVTLSHTKGIKGSSVKTIVFATGAYSRRVAAISQDRADAHNAEINEFNDNLDRAKKVLAAGKKLPDELEEKFSGIKMENIPKMGIPYDKAAWATKTAPHVAQILHPLPFVEAREAGTEIVPKESLAVDGSEHDIGIAHTLNTGGPRNHVIPHMEGNTLVGTELLTPVELTDGTLGEGGILGLLPANPLYIDGTRVGRALANYDQFRISEMVFEYQSDCPTTTAGAMEMEYLDDAGDMLVTETGFPALRDADSRADAVETNYWTCCETRLTFPQQKWYYTGGQDVPGLTIPGLIAMHTMNYLDATAGTLQYGFLRMHYKIETRAPSIPGAIQQDYFTSAAVITMDSATITQNLPVRTTPATSGLATNLKYMGVVYWGTVYQVLDPAGSSAWRTYQPGEDGDDDDNSIVIGPTAASVIFWRVLYVSGVENVCFFPTFNDAISADTYQSGARFYLAVSTVVGGVKALYVQDIQGTEVGGEKHEV